MTVAAASDLAPLGQELEQLCRKELGAECTFAFGASGALKRQIEQGAPYDVYLSANEGYVRELAAAGLVAEDTVRVYAVGTLGFWARGESSDVVATLRDPATKRVAIPNPQFAPYGVAARDYLVRQGLWEELQPKLILGENVRQTAQYASSGNVDAALSSWTLIKGLGGRQVAGSEYEAIRQAGAVVSATQRREEAAAFLTMLTGEAGRALLVQHDFLLP